VKRRVHLSCDNWLDNLNGSVQPLLIQECAAAEPVGDQPRSSMVPAATEAEAKSRKSVEPEAVKALAVATPVKSVVKHTVQGSNT